MYILTCHLSLCCLYHNHHVLTTKMHLMWYKISVFWCTFYKINVYTHMRTLKTSALQQPYVSNSRSWGNCPSYLYIQPFHLQWYPSCWRDCHGRLERQHAHPSTCPIHYSWSHHNPQGVSAHSLKRQLMWYRIWYYHVSKWLPPKI